MVKHGEPSRAQTFNEILLINVQDAENETYSLQKACLVFLNESFLKTNGWLDFKILRAFLLYSRSKKKCYSNSLSGTKGGNDIQSWSSKRGVILVRFDALI